MKEQQRSRRQEFSAQPCDVRQINNRFYCDRDGKPSELCFTRVIKNVGTKPEDMAKKNRTSFPTGTR